MNKEQQTIKAIQGDVPEIMDLVPGCNYIDQENNIKRVLGLGSGYTINFEIKKHKNDVIYNGGVLFVDDYATRLTSQNNICFNANRRVKEIIGRPITLLDIKKVFKQNNDFGSCHLVLKVWDMWNDKDDFTKQSKEIKELIGDLILKK